MLCAGTPIRRAVWVNLLLHNLADTAVTVDIGPQQGIEGTPYDLFLDGPYSAPNKKLTGLTVNGWGIPMDTPGPK